MFPYSFCSSNGISFLQRFLSWHEPPSQVFETPTQWFISRSSQAPRFFNSCVETLLKFNPECSFTPMTFAETFGVKLFFFALEDISNSDLAALCSYRCNWHLQPNVSKSISCIFHLHSACETRELSASLTGCPEKPEPHPAHLGGALRRLCLHHDHLITSSARVESCQT